MDVTGTTATTEEPTVTVDVTSIITSTDIAVIDTEVPTTTASALSTIISTDIAVINTEVPTATASALSIMIGMGSMLTNTKAPTAAAGALSAVTGTDIAVITAGALSTVTTDMATSKAVVTESAIVKSNSNFSLTGTMVALIASAGVVCLVAGLGIFNKVREMLVQDKSQYNPEGDVGKDDEVLKGEDGDAPDYHHRTTPSILDVGSSALPFGGGTVLPMREEAALRTDEGEATRLVYGSTIFDSTTLDSTTTPPPRYNPKVAYHYDSERSFIREETSATPATTTPVASPKNSDNTVANEYIIPTAVCIGGELVFPDDVSSCVFPEGSSIEESGDSSWVIVDKI